MKTVHRVARVVLAVAAALLFLLLAEPWKAPCAMAVVVLGGDGYSSWSLGEP